MQHHGRRCERTTRLGLFRQAQSPLEPRHALAHVRSARLRPARRSTRTRSRSSRRAFSRADVGVDATTWLIDEMRAAANAIPAHPPSSCCAHADGARACCSTVEAPLDVAAAHKPFVILVPSASTAPARRRPSASSRIGLKAQGHSVLLAAADTFRAAAVEQLQEWGERAGVPVVAQDPGRGSRGRRARRAGRGSRARHRRRARRYRRPAAYGGRAHGRAREDQARHAAFRPDARRTRRCSCSTRAKARTRSRRRCSFHERLGSRASRSRSSTAPRRAASCSRSRASSKCRSGFVARRRRRRRPRRVPRRRVRAGAARRTRGMIRFENVHKRYPTGREALSRRFVQHRARRVRVPDGPFGRRQEHAAALDRAHRAPDARHRAREQPEHRAHPAAQDSRRFGSGSASCSRTTSCSTTAACSTTSRLPLVIAGASRREIEKRVRAALDQVGLRGRESHRADHVVDGRAAARRHRARGRAAAGRADRGRADRQSRSRALARDHGAVHALQRGRRHAADRDARSRAHRAVAASAPAARCRPARRRHGRASAK